MHSSADLSKIKADLAHAITSFPPTSQLDGSNWGLYSTEVEMSMFTVDEVWDHMLGKSVRPSPNSAVLSREAEIKAWDTVEGLAFLFLWRTIKDVAIRAAHVKKSTPVASIWASLKAVYEKDTRSRRFELKRALYNPVHDTTKPVSEYIHAIVQASESLTALGHAPPSVDVVDSIIMHLDTSHPQWRLVRNLLTTRTSDPSLDELRSILVEHENMERLDEKAEAGAGESSVLYAGGKGKGKGKDKRSKKKRSPMPAHSESDSDHGGQSSSGTDDQSFSWLNPRDPARDCHRCGRRGHLARFCMFDMPAEVRDRIAQARRAGKKAFHTSLSSVGGDGLDDVVAGAAVDSDSDSDSGDSYSATQEHRALRKRVQA